MAITLVSRLAELEVIIEEGLQTFMAVGNALREISETKLYRPTYTNFEVYCQTRWNISKETAYAYMRSAKAAENVQELAPNITYTKALELSMLRPEQQRIVAKEMDIGTSTQAQIHQHIVQNYIRQETVLAPLAEVAESETQFVETAGEAKPELRGIDLVIGHSEHAAMSDMWMNADGMMRIGGSLLLVVEQRELPTFYRSFIGSEPNGLRFHNLLIVVHNRHVENRETRVDSCWSPVLWFTHGKYEGRYVSDVADSVTDFVQRLVFEGDRVVEIGGTDGELIRPVVRMGARYVRIGDWRTAIRIKRELGIEG